GFAPSLSPPPSAEESLSLESESCGEEHPVTARMQRAAPARPRVSLREITLKELSAVSRGTKPPMPTASSFSVFHVSTGVVAFKAGAQMQEKSYRSFIG